MADLNLLHLYLALQLGVVPLESRRDLWRQKTIDNGLSYGVVCMILVEPFWYSAGFCQIDRQMDGQTDGRTHYDSIYRVSIASRGSGKMGHVTVTMPPLGMVCHS